MGLFSLFKKPAILEDEFFGVLRFIDLKNTSENYFEGKGYFAPTNSQTEYLIQADKNGPTNKQKQFYSDLQVNFTQYVQKMKPLIENEFRNWEKDFVIKDFNKEFKLVCITIPRLDIIPIIWEMAFSSIHDQNHHVTIDFVDNQPNNILIDG